LLNDWLAASPALRPRRRLVCIVSDRASLNASWDGGGCCGHTERSMSRWLWDELDDTAKCPSPPSFRHHTRGRALSRQLFGFRGVPCAVPLTPALPRAARLAFPAPRSIIRNSALSARRHACSIFRASMPPHAFRAGWAALGRARRRSEGRCCRCRCRGRLRPRFR
jgi:hypothetical protein